MANHIPMDIINLNFTVEEWLDSETAEVTIDVDASLDADGRELKQKVKDSLTALNDSVTWRFSRVNRSRDRAGRETWQIGAQARMTDSALDDLAGKCRKLGEPGLQFRIGNVDYSPTAEAVETLNRSLREKINALIENELTRLKTELPDREWRVGNVQYGAHLSFSNSRVAGPNLNQTLMGASTQTMAVTYDEIADGTDDGGAGSGGFEVSQKVTLTAQVDISSTVDL